MAGTTFQDLAIGASGGLEARYLSYRPGLGAPNLIGFAIEPGLAVRLDTACGAVGMQHEARSGARIVM